jgi:hypothetical protein
LPFDAVLNYRNLSPGAGGGASACYRHFEVYTADLIAWLQQLEAGQRFILTATDFDYMEGYSTTAAEEPRALASRVYKSCRDMMNQSVGALDALARKLQRQNPYSWRDWGADGCCLLVDTNP